MSLASRVQARQKPCRARSRAQRRGRTSHHYLLLFPVSRLRHQRGFNKRWLYRLFIFKLRNPENREHAATLSPGATPNGLSQSREICQFWPLMASGDLNIDLSWHKKKFRDTSGSFEWLLRVIRSHMRSDAFLPLTFDRIHIDQRGWSQCVSLAEMRRLMCNTTYLDHHGTSCDLDLKQNFDIVFFRSIWIELDAFRREEQDGVRINSLAFLVQKLVAKNIVVITSMLTFHDLYSLTCRRYVNSNDKLAKEQFKSYQLLFLRPLTYNSYWDKAYFRRKTVFRKIWSFMTYVDLNIDVNEKMTKLVSNLFLMSFPTLFPFRATTHRSGVRRGGGGGRLDAPGRLQKFRSPVRANFAARGKHYYRSSIPLVWVIQTNENLYMLAIILDVKNIMHTIVSSQNSFLKQLLAIPAMETFTWHSHLSRIL